MPRLMIPVAAALSVGLMMFLAFQMGVPCLCMPLMLCLSPYFVFMHGTLLSHTSGFLAAACLLWAYLTWRRTDRSLFAALAGLAWSCLFLNRTYSALILAVPFGVDALVAVGFRRERNVIRGAFLFAACSALGIGLYLLYNSIMTGDPFLPTYLLCRSSEGLGFGQRSVYGVNFMEHTFARGLRVMWRNVLHLDHGLFGFRGSLVAALVLALVGRSRRYTPLLLASAFSVWIGYIFFYFPGILVAGPVYYFESIPFLFLAASMGVKRIWLLLERQRTLRQWVAVGAVAAVAIGGARGVHAECTRLRERSSYSRRVLDTIGSAPPNALVVLESIPIRPYLEELISNWRGLHSDPLVAHTMGDANTVLLRYFSERPPFILRAGEEDVLVPMSEPLPLVLDLKVWKMHRHTGSSHSYDHGVTAVRRASENSDRQGYLAFGVQEWISPGPYRVEFDLTTSGVTTEQPVTIDVAADSGRTILGRRDVAGEHTDERFAIDFVSSDYQLVEPRVFFGGVGEIELKHICIREVVDE